MECNEGISLGVYGDGVGVHVCSDALAHECATGSQRLNGEVVNIRAEIMK